jgi:hypothetical protein
MVDADHAVFSAMLVGMFGLLRKDNVTAGKARAAHDDAGLRRGDVVFKTPAGGAGPVIAWLRLRSSKTIQFGERVHMVPLVAIGGPLCPVAALRRHMADAPAGPDAYCFQLRQRRGGRLAPMSHAYFVRRMKDMLHSVGEDPSRYAGHSLRRGGATLAFTLGVERHLIKMQGDWLSDVVDRYNEMSPEARLALPRALARYVATLRG